MFQNDEDYLQGITQKENDLFKKLAICRKVEEITKLSGWTDILEPIIDSTIMGIIGGKYNGRWINGTLDRARKDERREFYIGKKAGLIEFHTRVMDHIKQIPIIESQIKVLQEDKVREPQIPMMEE